MREIKFERFDDGTWGRVQEDPNDPEFEIIDPIAADTVPSTIYNLTQKGWKIMKDNPEDFDGVILYRDD